MTNSGTAKADLRIVIAVGIGFFLCATLSVFFTRMQGHLALMWLANAPLVAALLARPASERPLHIGACFIASIGAVLLASPYQLMAPVFAMANVGEALIAWFLMRSLGVDARVFLSLRGLAVFVLSAGIIAPLIGGIVPAISLWLDDAVNPSAVWLTWAIAHGLGTVIVTPIAVLMLAGGQYHGLVPNDRNVMRQIALTALLIIVTAICFAQDNLPLLFLPIMPLIIVTMTYGVGGAAMGVFIIAAIGGIFTLYGHGPIELMNASSEFRLQFFQFYLATLFLTAMPSATSAARGQQLAIQVAKSEQRYRTITDHVSDVVLTFAPGGLIDFVSPSVRNVVGLPPEEVIGKAPVELVHPLDRTRIRSAYRNIVAEPHRDHRFEFRTHNKNGVTRWFEATARAVFDENNRVHHIVTVAREFSQHKAREADLLRQATTDPMTGVLNRRAFDERINRHFAAPSDGPAALAILDLDYFKQVNDRFGHAAGDAALLSFADTLRENLRAQDVIGRLGGEEFAIFFPGLTPLAAYQACERVRMAMQAVQLGSGESQFSITVSAGIAPVLTDHPPEESFHQADAALYRAKAAGRNRCELAQ